MNCYFARTHFLSVYGYITRQLMWPFSPHVTHALPYPAAKNCVPLFLAFVQSFIREWIENTLTVFEQGAPSSGSGENIISSWP